MYTGNPHQDRNPFATKWRDRINTDSRPPFHGGGAIPLPKDTMTREPWTGRFGPLAYNNDLPWMTVGEIDRDGGTEAWKRYSAGDPRYKWDPKRTPKVIQPRLDNTGAYSSTQLASAPHGYSTDNFYNPNDDQYYNDYEDDYYENPMRDDYFVQDPFSDIWGNQGGPLYFG